MWRVLCVWGAERRRRPSGKGRIRGGIQTPSLRYPLPAAIKKLISLADHLARQTLADAALAHHHSTRPWGPPALPQAHLEQDLRAVDVAQAGHHLLGHQCEAHWLLASLHGSPQPLQSAAAHSAPNDSFADAWLPAVWAKRSHAQHPARGFVVAWLPAASAKRSHAQRPTNAAQDHALHAPAGGVATVGATSNCFQISGPGVGLAVKSFPLQPLQQRRPSHCHWCTCTAARHAHGNTLAF